MQIELEQERSRYVYEVEFYSKYLPKCTDSVSHSGDTVFPIEKTLSADVGILCIYYGSDTVFIWEILTLIWEILSLHYGRHLEENSTYTSLLRGACYTTPAWAHILQYI